ncbi:29220_t:CDS:2, partial [Racocetra persica]
MLNTTSILSRQYTPEISRSPSEASSTSTRSTLVLFNQTNSEVGSTSFEVNNIPNQQTSETTDSISFSQTYEFESTSDLYKEQSLYQTSTFLDTINQPFTF